MIVCKKTRTLLSFCFRTSSNLNNTRYWMEPFQHMPMPDLSLVIPLLNEEESLRPLMGQIRGVLASRDRHLRSHLH